MDYPRDRSPLFDTSLVVLAGGAIMVTVLNPPWAWQLAPVAACLVLANLTPRSRRVGKGVGYPQALRRAQPWLVGAFALGVALLPHRVLALSIAIFLWAIQTAAELLRRRPGVVLTDPPTLDRHQVVIGWTLLGLGLIVLLLVLLVARL